MFNFDQKINGFTLKSEGFGIKVDRTGLSVGGI